MTKLPDSDDEGRDLEVPEVGSDVRQLIYLLEWARIRGFRLQGPIQIGDLIVKAIDLRQDEGQRRSAAEDVGAFEAYGHKE